MPLRPIIAFGDKNWALFLGKGINAVDMDNITPSRAQFLQRSIPVLQIRKVSPLGRAICEFYQRRGLCTLVSIDQIPSLKRRLTRAHDAALR